MKADLLEEFERNKMEAEVSLTSSLNKCSMIVILSIGLSSN